MSTEHGNKLGPEQMPSSPLHRFLADTGVLTRMGRKAHSTEQFLADMAKYSKTPVPGVLARFQAPLDEVLTARGKYPPNYSMLQAMEFVVETCDIIERHKLSDDDERILQASYNYIRDKWVQHALTSSN